MVCSGDLDDLNPVVTTSEEPPMTMEIKLTETGTMGVDETSTIGTWTDGQGRTTSAEVLPITASL
jgi:hypothetical protein